MFIHTIQDLEVFSWVNRLASHVSPMTILLLPLYFLVLYFGWQFLLISFRWVRWMIRRKLNYSHIPLAPGGWKLRITSDIHHFFYTDLPTMADAQGRLPACYDPGFFASGRSSITLIKPDDLKFLLFDAERFPKTPETRIIVEPMLGAGVLLTEGKIWFRQRKMLTPVFHSKYLMAMLPVMEKQILNTTVDLTASDDPILLSFANPIPFFDKLTLRIILAGCFGKDLDLNEMSNHWTAVGKVFVGWIIGRFFLGPLFEKLPFKSAKAMKTEVGMIKEHLRELIRQRAAYITDVDIDVDPAKVESGAVVDLLTLMMKQTDEQGNVLSQDELISQSLTIMFAGHETTSSVLSWCAYFLGLHPEIQERCFAEVRSFRIKYPNTTLTVELVRTQFPLLQAVFNETLRLRPPAPNLSRIILEETQFPSGLKMMPGDRAVIGIGACGLDGEYWPNPYEWNPDRWLQPDFVRPFFPVFSASARSCIGERFARLEGLLCLIHVTEKFRIDLDQTCKDQVVMKQVVTIQPANLRVRFSKRD